MPTRNACIRSKETCTVYMTKHFNTNMILGSRNRHDAKKELIQKRSKQYLLKNKAHQIRSLFTTHACSIEQIFNFYGSHI